MSVKVQQAVYDSALEHALRPLAIALAFFANDEGGQIWPGIPRLSAMLRSSPRAIHRGLVALLARQILVHDGKQGRARRYRFDLARLVVYRPSAPPHRPRQSTGDTNGTLTRASQFAARKSATGVRVPVAPTLPVVVGNSATGGTELCHPWSQTLPPVAPSDPYERQDPEILTGGRVSASHVTRSAPPPLRHDTTTKKDGRGRRPHVIGGSNCPHEPRCSSTAVCINRSLAEQRTQSVRQPGAGRPSATLELPVASSRRRAVETQQPAFLFDGPDPDRRAS